MDKDMDRENKTTFIIGAGASTEFNFPISSGLVEKIRDCLENVVGQILAEHGTFTHNEREIRSFSEFLKKNGDANIIHKCIKYLSLKRDASGNVTNQLDKNELNKYISAARTINNKLITGTTSIDTYLGWNDTTDYEVLISKIAITAIIRNCEYNSSIYENHNRKIDFRSQALSNSYLVQIYAKLNRMCNLKPEQIFKNKNFIIFNYDLCFEQLFFKYLRQNRSKSAIEAYQIIKSANIIHPHGTSNDFELSADGETNFGNINIDYNNCASFINHSRSNIKLHTELELNMEKKKQLEEMIYEANSVFILGFGYHPDNLQILSPSKNYKQIPNRKLIANIFGMKETGAISTLQKLGSIANGADIFPLDRYITRDINYSVSDVISEYESEIV